MSLLIISKGCLRSISTEALQSQNIMIPTPGGAGGTPVSDIVFHIEDDSQVVGLV